MKIALIMAHGNVHNCAGGGQKVFFNMANHFAKEHEVIAVYDDERPGAILYDVDNNVELINLRRPRRFSKLPLIKLKREILRGCERLTGIPKNYNALTKATQEFVASSLYPILQRKKPDICVAFNLSDLRALSICKEKGLEYKVITMCHTDAERVYGNLASYEKEALASTDVIQVLLKEYEPSILKVTDKPTAVIGNIVPQFVDSCNINEKRIIYLARIEKNKRQHLLIEALSKLSKAQLNGWKVSIFGHVADERYYENLLKMSADLGLTSIVEFPGITETPLKELKNSSICCFPSRLEGFSLALTEAMALGVPCIAFSDCPGMGSLISSGHNGYLVSSSDELAEKLYSLITDSELRRTQGESAKHSVEQFSEQLIWSQWEALFERLVK